MRANALYNIRLVIGGVMLLLGVGLLVRLHILGLPPKIPGPWMDTLFGIFLTVRGAMYLRMRRRMAVAPDQNPPGTFRRTG